MGSGGPDRRDAHLHLTGRLDLATACVQYAAKVAEYRVLANHELGSRPPNGNAFSPALYGSGSEHLAFLQHCGIVCGSGTPVTYPGPGDVDATGATTGSRTAPRSVARRP